MATEYASLFVSLIMAVYGIYKGITWSAASNLERVFACIAIIGAGLICFNSCKSMRKAERIEKIEARIGNIKAHDGKDVPTLKVGQANVKFEFPNGMKFDDADGKHILGCEMKDKKPIVNWLIYDREGSLLAGIHDNEWEVYTDKYEYQNNDYAFELVTKGEHQVFTQLNIKDGSLELQGHLMGRYKTGFFLHQEDKRTNSWMIFRDDFFDPDPSNIYIKPFFKYPRKTHLGELNQ